MIHFCPSAARNTASRLTLQLLRQPPQLSVVIAGHRVPEGGGDDHRWTLDSCAPFADSWPQQLLLGCAAGDKWRSLPAAVSRCQERAAAGGHDSSNGESMLAERSRPQTPSGTTRLRPRTIL